MAIARRKQVHLDTTPYYHCMSRCVRRAFLCGKDSFNNKNYDHRKQWIVERIKELGKIFAIDICAYAILSNYYHLLIETPKANLARIMPHINGVYTQRYNWLNKTDGSLFKGRYKSVLVDEDAYLLQLTR